jgi:Restriction endonuclease fold toxin 5
MRKMASLYQEHVTGAPGGIMYKVNGVKFDGWSGAELLEAKGPGYSRLVSDGSFRGSDAYSSLIGQAERQVKAAGGTPIRWTFAEKEAAEAFKADMKGIKSLEGQIEVTVEASKTPH